MNPGKWFAPFTARGAAVEEGIFAMNIVKKSTHAVINKIRPLIFSHVFVSINYMNVSWYWWDLGSVYNFFATIKGIWSQNFLYIREHLFVCPGGIYRYVPVTS